ARTSEALFSMHGRVRPPLPFQALSWAAKPKVRAVFYVDPWAHLLDRINRIDRLFGHDLVFIPYREAFDALRAEKGGERYLYLPFAADTRVFAPPPPDHPRDIDILWMGRRDEALHGALLRLSEAHDLNYLYREKTGFISDPAELGALAGRARYFVVTPPDAERSGGFSPLVMRYLEGLAAGCRLLGSLPRSGEFEALLPRESLLEVNVDGSDLEARYLADQSDAAGWAASAEATRIVHAEHGWDARARQIVDAIEQQLGERG
ncbi:MAG: hypothetical protein AAGE86_13530, partial [Pseudomonadota bacterium]